MSQLNICDKSPVSIGGRVSRTDFDEGRSGSGILDRFGDLIGRHFLDVLANFSDDCIIGVSLPAFRANATVIGIRFSDSFERYMATCAENLNILGHGASPNDSGQRYAGVSGASSI